MEAVAELVAWQPAPPRLLDQCHAGAAYRLVSGGPERLFGLLATRAIRPRIAERISFDQIAEAHGRLEAGGLEGKLVLCPDLPSRRDLMPPQREQGPTSVQKSPVT